MLTLLAITRLVSSASVLASIPCDALNEVSAHLTASDILSLVLSNLSLYAAHFNSFAESVGSIGRFSTVDSSLADLAYFDRSEFSEALPGQSTALRFRYLDLIYSIAAKSGFDSLQATLEDVWFFNQPELHEIFSAETVSPHALLAALRRYRRCLDAPLCKFLPGGLRSSQPKGLGIFLDSRGKYNNRFSSFLRFLDSRFCDDFTNRVFHQREGYAQVIYRKDDGRVVSVTEEGRLHLLPFARVVVRVNLGAGIEVWHAGAQVPIILPSPGCKLELVPSPDLRWVLLNLDIGSCVECYAVSLFASPPRVASLPSRSVSELRAYSGYMVSEKSTERDFESLAARDEEVILHVRVALGYLEKFGELPNATPLQQALRVVAASVLDDEAILSSTRKLLRGIYFHLADPIGLNCYTPGSIRDILTRIVSGEYSDHPQTVWDRLNERIDF